MHNNTRSASQSGFPASSVNLRHVPTFHFFELEIFHLISWQRLFLLGEALAPQTTCFRFKYLFFCDHKHDWKSSPLKISSRFHTEKCWSEGSNCNHCVCSSILWHDGRLWTWYETHCRNVKTYDCDIVWLWTYLRFTDLEKKKKRRISRGLQEQQGQKEKSRGFTDRATES